MSSTSSLLRAGGAGFAGGLAGRGDGAGGVGWAAGAAPADGGWGAGGGAGGALRVGV
jgi:hypothetical protein